MGYSGETDASFGPVLKSTNDFTLLFSHTILSILPSAVLIILTPILYCLFRKTPGIIAPSKNLYAKYGVAVTIFALELANLVLWTSSSHRRTDAAIADVVLALVAAICIGIVVHFEHRNTLRSTSLFAIWIFVTLLCDAARARSFFRRTGYNEIGGITSAVAALKGVLALLEEIPKSKHIEDEQTKEESGSEAVAGFWNRTLLIWLTPTLLRGFREILTLSHLDKLGPMFSSKLVFNRFSPKWQAGKRKSKHSLAVRALGFLAFPLLQSVLPRFCLIGFSIAQPLYLRRVVQYVKQPDGSSFTQGGLVATVVILYAGVAASRSRFGQATYRFTALLRSLLVTEIYKKTLELSYTEAQKTAATSLMSTDIEALIQGIPRAQEIWASLIEVPVCLFLLSTVVGKAAILAAVPVLLSFVIAGWIGNKMPANIKLWNQSIETRVSAASSMLSQIKAIKMVGLEQVVWKLSMALRENELNNSTKVREYRSHMVAFAVLCALLTGPLIIGGALFWTTFHGKLNAEDAFTTLGFAILINEPLNNLIMAYPNLTSALACLDRIQEFLNIEQKQPEAIKTSDNGDGDSDSANLDEKGQAQHTVEEKGSTLPNDSSNLFELVNASLAIQDTDTTVLHNLDISIKRHSVFMVVGPTGCGKSTFLKGILEESDLSAGRRYVEQGPKAFCDQTPWIQNKSIRDNIIAYSPFEAEWYEQVIDACQLTKDFNLFPHGDEKLAGSNGVKLSGGQKHRVALARALYARAPTIVLDDTFSALDRRTAGEIFEKLLGSDGLLRRSKTTVILATHSLQFFQSADQIMLIDGTGKATVESHLTNAAFQSHLQEILAQIAKDDKDDKEEDESSDDQSNESKKNEVPETEDEDTTRQKGDMAIYFFYLQSFRKGFFILFLVLTAFASFTEYFPDGYVRIWLEVAPNNNKYFIGYAVISVSSGIFAWLPIRLFTGPMLKQSAMHLYKLLLDTTMKARLSFLTGTDHGSILNRFSQDMTLTTMALPINFLIFFYSFASVLIRLGLIVAGTKYTAIIVPIIGLLLGTLQMFYLRTSRQMRYLDLEYKAPLYTQFTESAAGIQHIRAFKWEQQAMDVTFSLLDVSQKPFYHMYTLQQWLQLCLDYLSLLLGFVLVTLTVYIPAIATQSGIGLALVTIMGLNVTVELLIKSWTLLETSLGALQRLKTFIAETPTEEDPKPEDDTALPVAWPDKGKVTIKGLTAKYGTESDSPAVVKDVSLDVEPGQKIGIVGRTGCGKSSLLMSLLGFLDYTGTVTIDGVDISRISHQTLRSRLTTISQDTIELEGSVRYNLAPWTLEPDCDDKSHDFAIAEALWRVGMWEVISSKGGLDEKISALKLSHGQKQLLCIARALLRPELVGGRLVLMDEATSNLDSDTDKSVQKVMDEVFSGHTIIAVAHRTETLDDAHCIVKMADGKIVGMTQRTKEERTAGKDKVVPWSQRRETELPQEILDMRK